MVRVTAAALLDIVNRFAKANQVSLLEFLGIACIVILVGAVAGAVWMLCPAGVALLAKSAELDLKSRPPRGERR